jgi:hypothetical protein
MLIGMHEKDRRPTVRTGNAAQPAVTLWRMRSATDDNQASCSVTDVGKAGCDVLVVFAKGLGVPEHFDDIGAAVRHSMEIAGRLTAQGWLEIELSDR